MDPAVEFRPSEVGIWSWIRARWHCSQRAGRWVWRAANRMMIMLPLHRSRSKLAKSGKLADLETPVQLFGSVVENHAMIILAVSSIETVEDLLR